MALHYGRFLLAGALCLATACASEPEAENTPLATPPEASKSAAVKPEAKSTPVKAAPIPITEAPSFEREAGQLPGFFQGARCVVSAPTSTAEEKSFSEAFVTEFYKGGFKEAEKTSDFVVRVQYETATAGQSLEGRADVDQAIKSVATVRLLGGRTRASREFSVRLKHDQPTTKAQEAAMRVAHAGVTGRLLAQKLLMSLSHARGNAIRFEYTLVFKGYDRQANRDVRAAVLSAPGVDPKQVSERGGGKALVLTLNSEQAQASLSEAIVDKLADEDLEATVASPEPTVLIFTRAN